MFVDKAIELDRKRKKLEISEGGMCCLSQNGKKLKKVAHAGTQDREHRKPKQKGYYAYVHSILPLVYVILPVVVGKIVVIIAFGIP